MAQRLSAKKKLFKDEKQFLYLTYIQQPRINSIAYKNILIIIVLILIINKYGLIGRDRFFQDYHLSIQI